MSRCTACNKGPRGLAQLGAPDFPVTDLSHLLADFYDTAVAVQHLDLIITVDTSVGRARVHGLGRSHVNRAGVWIHAARPVLARVGLAQPAWIASKWRTRKRGCLRPCDARRSAAAGHGARHFDEHAQP